MHVEDALCKLIDRLHVVDLLPQEMGWVQVEAEALRRNLGEHPSPDGRRDRKILAPRPLIAGEKHGAVLYGNPHLLRFREAHELRPHRSELPEVLFKRPCGIPANERIHDIHAKTGGRRDHFLQVFAIVRRGLFVRIQRVGIVAQPRNRDLFLREVRPHAGRLRCPQGVNVHVRHPRIPPLRLSVRPAHQLHAGETFIRREGDDFLEAQLGKDGAHETQLHHGTCSFLTRAPRRPYPCWRELSHRG